MSLSEYGDVQSAITDEDSVVGKCIEEHSRYIEEGYGLPKKRSKVLSLAQFGVTSDVICEVLGVSERMVREHWTLIHQGSVIPRHYGDVFGNAETSFKNLGTLEGMWAWPWQHAITVEYPDPDIGVNGRKTVYQDPYYHNVGGVDYLVVSETTRTQKGLETSEKSRRIVPGGEALARHLSSSAETPYEYEAAAHAIELTKGDANGEVAPEEVLGLTYNELPTLNGSAEGRHATFVEKFRDTEVTARGSKIDWDAVRDEENRPYPDLETTRTEQGLEP